MFVHDFMPLNPPLPTSKVMDFLLEFLLKGPQTELQTLSQNCKQTLQKLRTNRIVNKRAFLKYINNLPGLFFLYSHRNNSLRNLANMRKMIPQKDFPAFARVRIQAPHAFTQQLIPQYFFPACIGFVPGGNGARFPRGIAAYAFHDETSTHCHYQKKIFWKTLMCSGSFPGWWSI